MNLLESQESTTMLFVHAFTGCDSDTTSRIYFGVGKNSVFQKVMKGDGSLRSCAREFTIPGQSTDVIVQDGHKALVLLFSGKGADKLTVLRHTILTQKAVSAVSFVTPERLPPTEEATKHHSLPTYFQIMTCMGEEADLEPTDWGWKAKTNQFIPVMNEMNAAPDSLLKVVHCRPNCTTGCSTQPCTCKTYGLPCTSACGQCQVQSCSNPFNQVLGDENENENDENDAEMI